MLRREPHQLAPPLEGERGAGRVVEVGDCVDQLGAAALRLDPRQRRGEGVRATAVLVDGHGDDPRAVAAEGAHRAGERRRLADHDVAAIEQRRADERNPAGRAVGEHEVLRRRRQAELARGALGELLAQALEAEPAAVSECAVVVARQRPTERFEQRRLRERRGVRDAPGEADRLAPAGELPGAGGQPPVGRRAGAQLARAAAEQRLGVSTGPEARRRLGDVALAAHEPASSSSSKTSEGSCTPSTTISSPAEMRPPSRMRTRMPPRPTRSRSSPGRSSRSCR